MKDRPAKGAKGKAKPAADEDPVGAACPNVEGLATLKAITEDYRAGRVVEREGWIISATEEAQSQPKR
ncbi:MAG: hypothetical protein WEB63_03965 [Cucumibacter sp.]